MPPVTDNGSVLPARLAFVAGALPLGGTTTYLLNLVTALQRAGVPLQVFVLDGHESRDEEFRRQGIKIVVQSANRLILEDRLAATLELIRRFAPSAVVAWGGPGPTEVLRYLPSAVACVAVLHSDHEQHVRVLLPYLGFLDHLVAVSAHLREQMAARAEFGGVDVRYLATGVPVPDVVPARAVATGQPLRILYLGRLHDSAKRVRLFPPILAHLREAGLEFVWSIAGDGPERAYLEESMPSRPPHQVVRFLGTVAYEEVPALLGEHDVLLLTSAWEGMPLSLLEAMAHGVVPVVTDLPSGIREVVDESTGWLVAPDGPADYAAALVWLAGHREVLAARAVAAARRVHQQFSQPAMAQRWLDLLGGGRPAPATWPATPAIQPPLVHPHPWFFRRPLPSLRRMVKRLAGRARDG